jgi:Glycosyl hydrolases family 6
VLAALPGAAPTYSSYTTYASAPAEIIGKSATGMRILTAVEAASVPEAQITRRASQFLRSAPDNAVYKVVNETVTPITASQWVGEGRPTPRLVNRPPALEYYTYASAPTELMVRTPVGGWRHATPEEVATVPASRIVHQGDTYYLQGVGEDQVWKESGGKTAPITKKQWVAEGSPTTTKVGAPASDSNPFVGHPPYVDPAYPSVAAAAALRAAGDETDAAQIDKISQHAGALWIGDWNPVAKVEGVVSAYVDAAIQAGQTGVLVLYGIPGRDCSGASAGGFAAADYPDWIEKIARGLARKRVAVVLEPDALMQLGRCPELEGDRTGLLSQATSVLVGAGATVYLDAGSSNSVPPAVMAPRLVAAGVLGARGFSTNVSNFKATAEVRAYADSISRLLEGKHYVIDTSRNGRGSNGQWCNPPGRGLGEIPGTTAHGNQDANLWIKTVGRSDGPCNGGPPAGAWWPAGALELARNAPAGLEH